MAVMATLRTARRKAGTGARLASSAEGRAELRYRLHNVIARYLYPPALYTTEKHAWYEDREFFEEYNRSHPGYPHAADRSFFFQSILALADLVPGDTAEAGVYTGITSWYICRHFEGSGRTHYAFDSFEGLAAPTTEDGSYAFEGALSVPSHLAAERLAGCNAVLMQGWIPDRFPEVADKCFAFVHIDVDLYQATLDSLAFFYPRMNTGGVILCDDYGDGRYPGAKRAFDEYMADKPEPIIHVPTGQGFLLKR